MDPTCSRRWRSAVSRGIMGAMKSFLAILTLLIAVSVACSAYKSAGSQSLVNSNSAVAQSPAESNNAGGQDKLPCTLTMDQAPDIKGLRLGMTADEVLAPFPGSKEDAELRASLSRPPSQFGASSFVIRPDRYESKEKYNGINQITFTLLDGRVYNLSVGYTGPEYSHVDKFVTKFIEGTSLPAADQWEAYVGM